MAEEKTLVQSKKAQSAWLGSAITTVIGVGLWKLGVPAEYSNMILGIIAGLFGSQILGQSAQDIFKSKENATNSKPTETNTTK